MYIRPVHAELDIPTLQSFIRANPLGLLTTSIAHSVHPRLQTSHIPFVLDEGVNARPGAASSSTESAEANVLEAPSLGTLRGHIARANPQYKAMAGSIDEKGTGPNGRELDDEVLILFQSPSHSYLTPAFYTSTKPATGKVVPTWLYSAVQVYGTLSLFNDDTDVTKAFLQNQVESLTAQEEIRRGGAWRVGDAPKPYVESLKRGIAGIEIRITRIEGRFKLSQESNDGDWEGVVAGMKGSNGEIQRAVGEMVEERGQDRPCVHAQLASTSLTGYIKGLFS